MPMPYSHFVLAQRVAEEGGFAIQDQAGYALGAFMPDIRYFTKLPREKYHFPASELEPYCNHDNVSKDFLLGYEVHLLIDEVWEDPDMKEAYYRAFPLFIRERITRGLQALAFEMYCLKEPVEVVELRPIENDLTRALEIKPSDIAWSVDSMQRYLKYHNLEAAYQMAEETKLFPENRLKTVKRVVDAMKNPVVRSLVGGVVTRASKPMLPRVVAAVMERLEQESQVLGHSVKIGGDEQPSADGETADQPAPHDFRKSVATEMDS